MTVRIKTGRLRLWFPVPLAALRLLPVLPDSMFSEVSVDQDTARALYRALRQAKKDFPGLELVHVQSADGEEVVVKL